MEDKIEDINGGMTAKEICKSRYEMEAEDDDMAALLEAVGKHIEDEEELLPEEMLTDNAWVIHKQWEKTEDGKWAFGGLDYSLASEDRERRLEITRKSQPKATQASIAANKERARLRNQRKTAIGRAALRQKEIHISDRIPREVMQELIAALTEDHTKMIEKLSSYINSRFTALLSPLIPITLRNCLRSYPKSVKKCAGFMYRASEEYGKGLCFWATPDIPYFFVQGMEQEILERRKKDFLFKIDKAIVQYDYHKRTRAAKEVAYAANVVRYAVRTYYDLLKLNPFWFETLYKVKTGKNLMTPKKNE